MVDSTELLVYGFVTAKVAESASSFCGSRYRYILIYSMNSSAAPRLSSLDRYAKAVPPTVSMPVSLYPLYEAAYCSLACTIIPSVTAVAERDFSVYCTV